MSKDSALAALTGVPATTQPSESSPQQGAPATPQNTQPQSTELKSTQFSIHAKKEAELVRQRNEFKREQEQWGQERQKLSDAKKQYDAYNEAKKSDPVAALKMLGFSETDIFNYMANAQPPELSPEQKAAQAAEAAAEARIKAFEEGQVKKQQEAQLEQDRGLINGFKSEISQSIKKNPEKFEYCAYYGPEAEALAYEITLQVVKDSNGSDVLKPEEALQMAEEYFEEKDREMSKLKKRNPAPSVESPKTEPERSRTVHPPTQAVSDIPKPSITKTRTLNNGLTSTVASTRQSRNETREQKRERLINQLRG